LFHVQFKIYFTTTAAVVCICARQYDCEAEIVKILCSQMFTIKVIQSY